MGKGSKENKVDLIAHKEMPDERKSHGKKNYEGSGREAHSSVLESVMCSVAIRVKKPRRRGEIASASRTQGDSLIKINK